VSEVKVDELPATFARPAHAVFVGGDGAVGLGDVMLAIDPRHALELAVVEQRVEPLRICTFLKVMLLLGAL
jgi:hypothetical protein